MGYLDGGGALGAGKTIARFAARTHAVWWPTILKAASGTTPYHMVSLSVP